MPSTTELIKELREKTGAGIMECKRAVDDALGDLDKAEKLLKERGLALAANKAGREAGQGLIDSYVHAGRIGAMIELNCETDFVARTDDFKTLAREIAMQVGATNPSRISAKEESSDGDVPLLDQPYIRDASKTIQELLNETIARVRENIVVRRFSRFELGGQVVRAHIRVTDVPSRNGLLRYRRILLKLSGEALQGSAPYGIDPSTLETIARQVAAVVERGVQVGMVIGGGNIWRGEPAATRGMDRATADYMGMLATVMNALALQSSMERIGLHPRVQSAVTMTEVAEPYIRRRAIRHFEKGRVVIFAAGTGNPYFTTDTAASLRALEIGAEVLLMAKNRVDGVYDGAPNRDSHAKKFDHLTYMEALERRLKVMDTTALSLCMDNKMPIIVFDLTDEGNLLRLVEGDRTVGTLVS